MGLEIVYFLGALVLLALSLGVLRPLVRGLLTPARVALAAPGAAPYVASKHAVLGLTKSAAVEYGRYGIRVNAVSPGAIRTELLLNVFGSQEALDRLGSSHPLSRIGLPEEVAETVVWLFSENSSYLSGQSIVLDGGLSAQRPGVGPSKHEDKWMMPKIFPVITNRTSR